MGRVFFLSDSHFGHSNIVKPTFDAPRPFENIAQHDATIIANWNAVVRPGDQVYHLGDFQHRCPPDRTAQIFKTLNGDKHLIVGNHDKSHVINLPWASKPEHIKLISVEGQRLCLCHYGMRTWPGLHRGALLLFGHSHGSMPGTKQSQDVGVDVFGFRPVQLDEIRARMELNADIEGVARPDEAEPGEDAELDEGTGYAGP